MIDPKELTWSVGAGTSEVKGDVPMKDVMAPLMRDATQAALATAQEWLNKYAKGRPVQIVGTALSSYVGDRFVTVVATIHFRCGQILSVSDT